MRTKYSDYQFCQILLSKYKEKKTMVKHCKNEHQKTILNKIIDRIESKQPEITVRSFCQILILKKLNRIASAMPIEGYSMGSKIVVSFQRISGIYDSREYYAKSCGYQSTHGGYSIKMTLDELKNTNVIGGLVTYIYPNQKSKIKKCFVYVGIGSKQYFVLQKKEMFLFNDFHFTNMDDYKRYLERQKANKEALKQREKQAKEIQKVLRKQFTFQDSINCGNCEAGSLAFVRALNLNRDKKYRGTYLIKLAKEKQKEYAVSFILRMAQFKLNLISK